MTHTKYCYSTGGNSVLIRKVFEEIINEINPVLVDIDWEESAESFYKIKALDTRFIPKMDASSEVVFLLGMFVISSFGNELLGTIYDETIKQPFADIVRKVLKQNCKRKPFQYEFLEYYEDIDVSILIQILVNNEHEVGMYFDNISKVLKIAREWIKSNGKKAEIHRYTIKEGKYSPVPDFFNSIEEARQKPM